MCPVSSGQVQSLCAFLLKWRRDQKHTWQRRGKHVTKLRGGVIRSSRLWLWILIAVAGVPSNRLLAATLSFPEIVVCAGDSVGVSVNYPLWDDPSGLERRVAPVSEAEGVCH